MGSNIFAAVTKAPSADTITKEAEATTTLLDSASSKMRGIESINVSTHLEELSKIRSLVQKIRYQQGLQTCSVATALATLKGVAEKLEQVLGVPQKVLQIQLPNIMDELREAGKNLRQQLPGDISTALRNEANQGLQINAALGGNRPEGRVLTEAIANRSTSASQINAPIYGDPSFVRDLNPATNQTGAAE
ncbi:hypothetical protein J3E69DRAFT_337775 [Trichoderma sp. SZMC 28015]